MSSSGHYFVYILASRKYGALYIGITGNLPARIYIHKELLLNGFSARYHTHSLVYFEQHDTAIAAITREKQMKKWNRAWKIALIEKANAGWQDLYDIIAS